MWDGRISPLFDVCREVLIVNIQVDQVTSTLREPLESSDPLVKVRRLVDLGVDTLICGAISEPVHRELRSLGVEVLGFVTGEAREVLQAHLMGARPGVATRSIPGPRRRTRRRLRGHPRKEDT